MQSKPLSPARLAANRANAAKSTGPRTTDGKQRVSQNALKHGLHSERNPLELAVDTATPIEHHEFLRILSDFIHELAPATPLETRLVERMAQLELRLQRALRLETAQLTSKALEVRAEQSHQQEPNPANAQPVHLTRMDDGYLLLEAYVRGSGTLDRIGRYESRLGREFARTWKQLKEAQSRPAEMRSPVGEVADELTPDPAAQQKMTKQTHHIEENTTMAEKQTHHAAHNPG